MNHLDRIFHMWNVLYDKHQDPKSVIEEFFHEDYTQSINSVVLNRDEYITHVIEQRKSIDTMGFECKIHMTQHDKVFVLYNAKGQTIQSDEIEAEIIAYFEFKNKKIVKIHGQVHLLKGRPSDVDMNENVA